MLPLLQRPNLQGRKKNIRNLVPFYAFDIVKLRHLFAMTERDRMDVIFSRAYREFSKDFVITEQITYGAVYKSTHGRIDKMIPDKMALIMLHIHNHILDFLPFDYPKHLIRGALTKYPWKVGLNDGFEDVLAIESIFSPLNYFLVLKLGYLLGLNRNKLNRIFADSLTPYMLRQLGSKQPNIPFETMLYPEKSHNITLGFSRFANYAKDRSEIIKEKGFFDRTETGRIICHTDFLKTIQTAEEKNHYRKMVGFSPYMNARFWYSLAKSLGLYDPVEIRKKINALNSEDIYEYRKLADYLYYLELKK